MQAHVVDGADMREQPDPRSPKAEASNRTSAIRSRGDDPRLVHHQPVRLDQPLRAKAGSRALDRSWAAAHEQFSWSARARTCSPKPREHVKVTTARRLVTDRCATPREPVTPRRAKPERCSRQAPAHEMSVVALPFARARTTHRRFTKRVVFP